MKNLAADPNLPMHFVDSADYGRQHLDDIIATESEKRNLSPELVRRYLREHTSFDLGEREQHSLATFLRSAAELGIVGPLTELAYLEEPAVAERE